MTSDHVDEHVPGRGSDPKAAKVTFRLFQDEDGYPPADWEHLWAHEVGEALFVLDNIPFFARGVSTGDLVAVDRKGGVNEFREVIQPSGHSTIRVIFFDTSFVNELRARLKELGCDTEQSHLPNLIAVDIPPSADLDRVRSALTEGEDAAKWEYEEAAIP